MYLAPRRRAADTFPKMRQRILGHSRGEKRSLRGSISDIPRCESGGLSALQDPVSLANLQFGRFSNDDRYLLAVDGAAI